MAEAGLLFRNRMGRANWAFIVLGFGLAVPLLVAQGSDLGLALVICALLAVFAIVLVACVIVIMGRSHVAELTQRGDLLEIEMLSPLGRGRTIRLPVSEAQDWRLTSRHPRLRFHHAGQDYVMPLQGAQVDWPAIQAAVPHILRIGR